MAKLPRGVLQPLLDSMADRLPAWKGRLLRRSRRLTLIKTTLSTVPIYTSISLGLLPWLLREMRKFMTTFMWMGTNVVQRGKCLLAWDRVQRPLHLGGLVCWTLTSSVLHCTLVGSGYATWRPTILGHP
jgi:hypothetical protein